MTPKQHRTFMWALFSPLIGCVGIMIFLVILIIMPTHPYQRRKMAEHYRNSEYLTLYGTIDDYYSYDNGAIFRLVLNEECINSLTEEQLASFGEAWISVTYAQYELAPNCEKALRDNGFFDLMKTDERGRFYSEETVTIIVNHVSWHAEDTPYAVGFSVGDTVYLDLETGKELLIDYVLHDMY